MHVTFTTHLQPHKSCLRVIKCGLEVAGCTVHMSEKVVKSR